MSTSIVFCLITYYFVLWLVFCFLLAHSMSSKRFAIAFTMLVVVKLSLTKDGPSTGLIGEQLTTGTKQPTACQPTIG